MFEIQKDLGLGWNFAVPNTRKADAMVKRILKTQYTENLTIAHVEDIKQKITAGILSGKTTKQIAEDVQEGSDDELWRTKRLVRTELTSAAAEGELEAIKEMKYDNYRFYATIDEKTCPICGDLDMEVFPVNDAMEGKNKPAMHPNCRCVIHSAPSDEQKEDIKRNIKVTDPETGKKMYKDLPPGMTFNQWQAEIAGMPERVAVDPDLRWMANNAIEREQIDPAFRAMAMNEREEGVVKASTLSFAKGSDFDYPPALPPDNAEKAKLLEKTIRERLPNAEVFGIEKADAELVGKMYERLAEDFDKYPKDANSVLSFEVKEMGKDDIMGVFTVVKDDGTVGTRIMLNSKVLSNSDEYIKAFKKSVDDGWFPAGADPYNVLRDHEFRGHIRSANLYAETYGKSVKQSDFVDLPGKASKFEKYSEKLVNEAAYRIDPKISTFVYPSNYAKESYQELIAEAYSDVGANGVNAKPISKEIVKMIDEGWRPLSKSEEMARFKAFMSKL